MCKNEILYLNQLNKYINIYSDLMMSMTHLNSISIGITFDVFIYFYLWRDKLGYHQLRTCGYLMTSSSAQTNINCGQLDFYLMINKYVDIRVQYVFGNWYSNSIWFLFCGNQ